jgi:hypothetical protein
MTDPPQDGVERGPHDGAGPSPADPDRFPTEPAPTLPPGFPTPGYGPTPPYGTAPGYGSTPPYGPPAEPYGSQPYGAQPHGGQPSGGQPYAGQPYGGPFYAGQPYGAPGQPFGPPPGPPPKSRVGLIAILTAVALLVIAAVVVLVRAQQATVLDASSAERDVAAQFEQREGVAIDLACPDDMKIRAGATYDCRGKTADGETVRLRLTITDVKNAAYTWAEP